MITNKNFAWGPIVKVHEISGFEIVEYHPQIFDGSTGTGKYNYKETRFHPYIDGKDTSTGHDSLDAALIYAIAQKYDGRNTKAHIYFQKMIEMR